MKDIFQELKVLLHRRGFKEQKCGEISLNGEIGTSFWKDNEIVHVSFDYMADQEIIQRIKSKL